MATAKKTAAKAATTKTTTAKKTTAKAATAKKPITKKTTAKAATAKKSIAKKTTTKAANSKKIIAKKTTAKKTAKKAIKAENKFSFEKLPNNIKLAVLANLGLYGKILDQAQANYELAQSHLEFAQEKIQNVFSVSSAAHFNELVERGEQLQTEVKGKVEDLTGAIDLEANLSKVRTAVESVKNRLIPKAAA